MATLNQNGINFTLNADVLGSIGSGKYTNSANYDDNTGLYTQNQTKLDKKGVEVSVNAVEIDWNSAKLDNVELSVLDNKNTVNTTGQLLALINDLQEQINAIVYIMNGGNTGGDNSGSSSGNGSDFTSTTTSSTGFPTTTTTGF